MRRYRDFPLIIAATLLPLLGACGESTGPGDPQGDLEVELRNFRAEAWEMGLVSGPVTTILGNGVSGNPTAYTVTNPGIGGSLSFFATPGAGGDTLSATCTVTTATGVSEPPQVVVQAGFTLLDCVSW